VKNLLIIAAVWYVHLNNYFGWNWKPQSIEELAADGFCILLVAMAFFGKEE